MKGFGGGGEQRNGSCLGARSRYNGAATHAGLSLGGTRARGGSLSRFVFPRQ